MAELKDIKSDKIKDIIYLDDVKDSMLNGFNNGYELGKTTYFNEIDNHFRWLKKNVQIFGGYGNHGKSTLLYQMILLRALYKDEKAVIFSPENLPSDYFYNDLIHTLVGKSTIKQHSNQMSLVEYHAGMDFIKDHFFLIYPENDNPTPEFINSKFKEVIDKYGVDFCITDPFNQLDRDWEVSGRDDKYLSDYLNKEKRFAQENDIYKITVAHCNSGRVSFEDNGMLKEPTVYNLAGGAMWSNKADDILFIHRPYKHSDPSDTTTFFISDKIKKQRICGYPGRVELSFDILTNRFLINGYSPFEGLDSWIPNNLESKAPF